MNTVEESSDKLGKPWDWDILDYVNDRDSPKRPDSYRMINVMCYLMRPLTYREFFDGDIKTQVLPRLVSRIMENNYASAWYFRNPRNGQPMRQYARELADKLSDIINDGNVASNTPMRALYEAKRKTQPDDFPERFPVVDDHGVAALWHGFGNLRKLDRRRPDGPVFNHLCMPFLYQQSGIDPAVIDRFIHGKTDASIPVIGKMHGLGRFSLVELYQYTKTELGILLLDDMYNEARTKDTSIQEDVFQCPDMQERMAGFVKELISLGQTTSMLILHSPFRVTELKALKEEIAQVESSFSLLNSKPNDQCCDGNNCDPMPDHFCSKSLSLGCSAQSDDCASKTCGCE